MRVSNTPKRYKNRNNGSRNNGYRNNGSRRGNNISSNNYDSNGKENKIKGNAIQVHEKYQSLARDAVSSGDTIKAEYYFQHAEHYHRVHKTSETLGNGKSEKFNKERIEINKNNKIENLEDTKNKLKEE
tara:strand:+ start:8481 stop:8867 length:387 start_codon:yes stop_codon:yes gene_type:complete